MTAPARQRGYSLIELLIAMGILGVVLLSILSLFVIGRRNVYAGKQQTTAIAIGTKVLEDIAPLTKDDVYAGAFAITANSSGTTIKFGEPQQTYDNAAIRSTKAYSYTDIQKQTTGGPDFLTGAWKNELLNSDGKAKLDDGAVTVILMPRAGATDPATFANASVLRMRVIVGWNENQRRREVILDTVKAQ